MRLLTSWHTLARACISFLKSNFLSGFPGDIKIFLM